MPNDRKKIGADESRQPLWLSSFVLKLIRNVLTELFNDVSDLNKVLI
jgi:hypothetical protein